jgi:hemoglobin
MMKRGLLILAAAVVLGGCRSGYGGGAATPVAAAPASGPSLYLRLGGVDAIRAVVDDFTARLAGDTRINMMFGGVDVDRLKRLLVEQICEATGGPCRYTGRSMREAHTGLGITEEQWDITVAHLVATLDRFNVGQRERNELLGALAAMKGDIVGR